MPLYSYELSKEKLSDVEKERIVAIFLSREDVFGNVPYRFLRSSPLTMLMNPQTDWNRGTKAFGSASIDSMKKSLSNSLKKIIVTEEDEADAATTGHDTPKAPVSKVRRRKRKADVATPGEDGDMPNPTPKKRGRSAKSKVKVEETGAENDNGGDMMVNDVSAAAEDA
ncbi:hypothetical protein BDV97DRAFT_227095 [Delphinella strobiligena]|nr:hypothetical protein BDV97DRAFT_227095 [Delphinella strobiligena]